MSVNFSYQTKQTLFTTFLQNNFQTHYLNNNLNNIEKAIKNKYAGSSYTIINYTFNDDKFLIKIFSDRNIGTYCLFDLTNNKFFKTGLLSNEVKKSNLKNKEIVHDHFIQRKKSMNLLFNLLLENPNMSVDEFIVVGTSQQYGQAPYPGGFITTIKSLFCDGNKLKTDKKTSEVINKPKTIKLTLSDEERCVLPNDKKWSYAKQKDRWFASKNNVDWFDITNNKKAVNILTTKCKSIKEFLSFKLL